MSGVNAKTAIVLSGGSAKGIAHIGVLKGLEERDVMKNIKIMAGTSIGGLIASMSVIGYSADEMFSFIELFDMRKIRSLNINGFVSNYGFDKGTKFEIMLEKLFDEKKISPKITFKELYDKTSITLILTTVCIDDRDVIYISYKTHPNMSVITGIRMTTCFPIWFSPIEHEGKLYVDGGCIDNYPVKAVKSFFANDIDVEKNVIGVYLCEAKNSHDKIKNGEEYLLGLIKCFTYGISINCVKGYENFTIKIPLRGISIINLDISRDIKKELYDCGYDAINKYCVTLM